MADGDQKAEPIKYWKIQAEGIADVGLFYECSLPSMSLTAQDFKVWDQQGKPDPLPVGVQATFGDVTLARLVDKQSALWNWISTIAQKGASSDTVKQVSLLACDAEGNPVQTWVLDNCYPVNYVATASGNHAAGGTAQFAESMQLHYTNATLDGKGGLTGSLE